MSKCKNSPTLFQERNLEDNNQVDIELLTDSNDGPEVCLPMQLSCNPDMIKHIGRR